MYSIRSVLPTDAPAVLCFLKTLHSLPTPTIRRMSEFPTLLQERHWIESRQGEGGIIFAVFEESRIVGLLDAQIPEAFEFRHCCRLGISVLHDHRRQGLGRALMQEVMVWAKAVALERLELEVMEGNDAAIALYTSLGFVEEGRRVKGVRVDEEQRCDMLWMALPL